jgi:hypothetical protein
MIFQALTQILGGSYLDTVSSIWTLSPKIMKIANFTHFIASITPFYVRRKANGLADKLANEAMAMKTQEITT